MPDLAVLEDADLTEIGKRQGSPHSFSVILTLIIGVRSSGVRKPAVCNQR